MLFGCVIARSSMRACNAAPAARAGRYVGRVDCSRWHSVRFLGGFPPHVFAAMLQAALCDSWLDWGGRLVPLQSSACARSSVLDMALRQAAKKGPGGGPVLTLDSSQLDSLRACVGRLTPLALERFLATLAGAALEKHCSEVSELHQKRL